MDKIEQNRKARYAAQMAAHKARRSKAVALAAKFGQSEAARKLGISRQRMHQIIEQEGAA